MKTSLFYFIAAIITIFPFHFSVAEEVAKPKANARMPRLPMICPSEWAGNPEPVVKITQKGMPTLLVCSERDFERQKTGAEKIELSLFKVLALTSRGAKPEVFFDSKNENEVYRIIPLEAGVQISEQYEFRSKRIPLLSFSVKCTEAGCRRGRKGCVIPERAKNPHPKALNEWKKRIDEVEKADVTGETPLDELVDQLFEQALTGDLKAYLSFDRADTPEKLPRDAKKLYLAHQKALKRAKLGGCFQEDIGSKTVEGSAPAPVENQPGKGSADQTD
jgi:hypothetical protein